MQTGLGVGYFNPIFNRRSYNQALHSNKARLPTTMAQRNCSTSGCGGGGCGGGGGGGAMRPPASSSSLSSSIDPQQPKPEVGGGWNALGNGGNGAIKPRGRRRLQLQQEAAAATAAKEKKKSKGGDGRGSSTKTKYSHSSILLMVIVSLWILSVVSMVVAPSSQGLLTYLHWIKWPLFRDLNDLVSFRLPHARNIRVRFLKKGRMEAC